MNRVSVSGCLVGASGGIWKFGPNRSELRGKIGPDIG